MRITLVGVLAVAGVAVVIALVWMSLSQTSLRASKGTPADLKPDTTTPSPHPGF